MTTDTTAEHDVITPEDAASRIAERLKARDSWIVTIPPAVFPAALRRLGKLFGTVIYTDHGIDSVITVTTPSDANQLADFVEAAVALSAITGADYTATAVAVIPKTVPRGMFQRALGQKLPAGTDQDVILLLGPSG